MQTILLLFQLALRNLRRNRRRTFLTVFAISAGLWSSLGIACIARGLSTQMALNAINNLTGHLQVHAKGYLLDPSVDSSMDAPSDAFIRELTAPSITAWSTRVRVPGVVMSERETKGVSLVGIDPAQEKGLSFIGNAAIEGSQLSGPTDKGIVMGRKLAELLRTGLGKRVVLMSEGRDGKVRDRGFRIIGIFDADLESSERSFVFIGRATAQEMLDLGSQVSEVAVRSNDRFELEEARSILNRVFTQHDVQDWTTLEPLAVAVTKIQNGFLFLWSIIVLIMIAFGLVNTMFMAIFERTREFGLFQALGMKPSSILFQVLFESALLLVVGGLVGNLLSFGTVALFRDGIDLSHFAAGTSQLQVSRIFYPTMLLRDWAVANSVILVISLASAFYPARRASKLEVLEALGR